MANKGREYAENLVGPLDRSVYNQQRDVAQNTYNTNWQNVQNQYKNLQDKLKLQQQRANQDFAEGLVDVAENSLNRERMGSANLANRGLSASGLTNILNQVDTAQKGEEIGKLLKSAGAISTDTADKLSQATSKFAQEGTGLMGRLADTLGDVGDAETAAQNRYNQVLAGIAGAMDQREAENELQAAQRAANRASSGRSSAQRKANDELEEFYKRATINEILSNPDMTDSQKQNYLGIMFGVDNAGNVVTAYNNNVNATDNYNKKLQEYENNLKKEQNVSNAYRREAEDLISSINSDRTKKSWDDSNNKARRDAYYVLYDYINGNDKGYSKKDVADAYSKFTDSRQGNAQKNYIADALDAVLYPQEFNLRKEYNEYKNSPITYEDLAALLYGNR